MPVIPKNIDYSTRDFRALRVRLRNLTRTVFPDWNDFDSPTFGNILLDLYAFVGDILAFYQDAQAKELFWPTVTQRVSAIRLARLINFKLPTATAATGTARFYVDAPPPDDIDIPAGTRVRTVGNDPIVFRTTVDATLPTTNTYVDVPIEHAELIQGEVFPATGEPNQTITLSRGPYIDGTAVVKVGAVTWYEVDSFVEEDPTSPGNPIGPDSPVYVLSVDEVGKAVIQFGNGKSGKIPDASISVDYKIGGGAVGNVDANTITEIEGVLYYVGGGIAEVRVTNPQPTSGGTDRMSVTEARVRAPASLRVLERTVTKEDFEIVALSIPGVARAAMVTSNEDASVEENSGVLLVVAKGEKLESGRYLPAAPSSTMLSDVLTEVTSKKPHTLTFQVTTEAPQFRSINVYTRVFLEPGYDPSVVGNNIRESLKNFFAATLEDGSPNPKIDFGANLKDSLGRVVGEIIWSDVFNAIRDSEGVRKVYEGHDGLLLNGVHASVRIGPREFPVLGSVTIIDGDTGSAI